MSIDQITDQKPSDGPRMSFGGHLNELRFRLIKSLAATLITFIAANCVGDWLMRLVVAPYQKVMRDLQGDPLLKVSSPADSFLIWFKVTLVVSLISAAPVWLYQIWAFIAAGLHSHEKKWVTRYAPFSLGLFFVGIAFGYTLLLPIGLRYLLTFGDPQIIQNWIGLSDYLTLFITLTLLLGATFQLPVLMLGVMKAGLISPEAFRKKRRITILLIFIIAGILTPPDPITQSLVAVPLCLLFELGIFLGTIATTGRAPGIDWVWLRQRWRFGLAFLLIAILLKGAVVRALNAYRADQKVQTALQSSTGLPWSDTGATFLRAEPDGCIVIAENGMEGLVLVTTAERACVVRFKPGKSRAVVSAVTSRSAVVMGVPPGAVTWEADLPADVRVAGLRGPLLAVRQWGSEENRGIGQRALVAVTGLHPAGDDDAVLKAFDAWFDAHPNDVFPQP